MAARLSLLALALWLAVAFAAEAPPTCSDPAFESSGSIYVVQDGNLTGDDDAAAAVLLLQAFVASELHKDEACEVTETVIDGIACSRVSAVVPPPAQPTSPCHHPHIVSRRPDPGSPACPRPSLHQCTTA